MSNSNMNIQVGVVILGQILNFLKKNSSNEPFLTIFE